MATTATPNSGAAPKKNKKKKEETALDNELRNGSEPTGRAQAPVETTLTGLLKRRTGECCAFDYDGRGRADHVLFLDAGAGI
ncbi:MAG: hypothetical protein JOY54_15160 [Acidobacteriaceae bacterium]|nr:hypothetical protein [Acidobacteriaceae bacterium]